MKVLVAPLDWGLGHATRCVPVIKEFLRQGAQVELAVTDIRLRLMVLFIRNTDSIWGFGS